MAERAPTTSEGAQARDRRRRHRAADALVERARKRLGHLLRHELRVVAVFLSKVRPGVRLQRGRGRPIFGRTPPRARELTGSWSSPRPRAVS
jgi:hypothetical protein